MPAQERAQIANLAPDARSFGARLPSARRIGRSWPLHLVGRVGRSGFGNDDLDFADLGRLLRLNAGTRRQKHALRTQFDRSRGPVRQIRGGRIEQDGTAAGRRQVVTRHLRGRAIAGIEAGGLAIEPVPRGEIGLVPLERAEEVFEHAFEPGHGAR